MDLYSKWEKVVKEAESRDAEMFYLLDGPPYPNAEPHLGHVRGLSIKDFLIKYHTMKGKRIFILPGFDAHGLPIENKVEKELGIKSKKEIEEMGASEFIKRCREFATSNINMWMDFYKKMGIWFYMKEPYITTSKRYMNSVWWSIKQLYNKGLIKRGGKPFYWCPHCQTVLSGYEVTDEYKELEDTSIFVKFKTEKGFYLLVWTTTPWTLPANVALVVRPDATYVEVDVNGERLVLAKSRIEVLKKVTDSFKIIREFKGEELIGLRYEPVVDCKAQKALDNNPKARRVYASIPVIKQKVAGKVKEKKAVEGETEVAEFVNLEEGTGIVHCAPGHGPEDYELGKHYSLPILSPVDDEGRFTEEVELFAGKRVRDANEEVIEYLKSKGFLFYAERIKHRYPVCWRCKTPLIFRLTEQWYLDIEEIKPKLIEEVKKTKWLPEFAKERMLNWVENATEWILSRQRYWNIPLPIWQCKNGHIKVVESAEELESLSGQKVNDLHRDVVDKITFKCPICGEEMHRVNDVLDVWYDSGAASFAAIGYPFENKDLFAHTFPVSRIEEGQDQIRGWFYTLLVLGVALFDTAPYKEVSMHGWVLDEKGEKMSKSKGNFIAGREALEVLGPDLLRFYIMWDSSPWEGISFSYERAKKEVGKFFNILRNLVTYLEHFANTSGKEEERIEDLWITSRWNSTLKQYHEAIASYRMNTALRAIWSFVINDLSKVYMKIAKERVRKGDSRPVKLLSQLVLEVVKAIAPAAPFIAEELYAKLGDKESVFLDSMPEAREDLIDEELEARFAKMLGYVEEVLSWRDANAYGLRYPLAKVYAEGIEGLEDILLNFANIKEFAHGKDGLEKIAEGIYLDTNITEELLQEGYAREIARRLQAMRKDLKLKQEETINASISGDERLIEAVKTHIDFIKERANIKNLYFEPKELEHTKKWKIKGMEITLSIERIE